MMITAIVYDGKLAEPSAPPVNITFDPLAVESFRSGFQDRSDWNVDQIIEITMRSRDTFCVIDRDGAIGAQIEEIKAAEIRFFLCDSFDEIAVVGESSE